ncbi:hypothetical protein O181_024743 [Austropuccinia psidii MF-1]|uniref:F-box domain-containing protein n=1 Tax=Austropuccinia psidii MF-1 TaxID=1389203 RepID=A0A9Q3CJG3_9BASI|nr:hypothetical protein [Austropuccinia psidii MF-1]
MDKLFYSNHSKSKINPIAGFRAQHHNYHQNLLKSSNINLKTSIYSNITSQLFYRLPHQAIRKILIYSSPDQIPILARVCRRFNNFSQDEQVWKSKLDWLDYKGPLIPSNTAHDSFENSHSTNKDILDKESDDNFGDFVMGSSDTILSSNSSSLQIHKSKSKIDPFDLNQLKLVPTHHHSNSKNSNFSSINSNSLKSKSQPNSNLLLPTTQFQTSRELFFHYFNSLLPYLHSLLSQASDSLLFTDSNLTILHRAQLISTLKRLLFNPFLAPSKYYSNPNLIKNLQNATDLFQNDLLSQFDRYDQEHDEIGMKSIAHVIWQLGRDSNSARHNLIQAFIEKREIFYDTRFNPLDNLVKSEAPNGQIADGMDFAPMETYIRHVLESIEHEGSLIARIFPPKPPTLLFFIEKIASEVLYEYITPLLSSTQSLPHPLFLLTAVAIYSQLRRVVDTTMSIKPINPNISFEQVQNVIHQMFEIYLDDYLQEEVHWVKTALEGICLEWDTIGNQNIHLSQIESVPNGFLSSTNPALMKKNILSSFKSALLLPVSVVPKTVMYSFNAISTAGVGAFNTMTNGLVIPKNATDNYPSSTGYKDAQFLTNGSVLGNELESWLDDAEDDMTSNLHAESKSSILPNQSFDLSNLDNENDPCHESLDSDKPSQSHLGLFLSIDTSLKLISTNRESLKRVESFKHYTGKFKVKVKDTLEEVFIILLQTLGQKHFQVAFDKAFQQMSKHKTKQSLLHQSNAKLMNSKTAMAPLVDFFELVHLADTIQQMVEVYFDQEMSQYIDRTDFLNMVVREKRGFESNLDDCVAKGLNLGVDLLMDQIESLMIEHHSPLDFCPTESSHKNQIANLEPTLACRNVISCLDRHCQMLKGNTDKKIMEVFYQEVGLRLHGILCKHLKRSIISIEGGVQLISDLNQYHQFISNFNQPDIITYFASLKTVGNLFIIDSIKDLSQLIKDIHLFNGVLNSEDLYEFLKRRTDWKRIEKQIEREIYGFGREDCILN